MPPAASALAPPAPARARASQAASYKKRVWQYLSSALPHYDPLEEEWDRDPDAPEWVTFRMRCDNVTSMLKYLTAKVDLDSVNYADIDDIFSQTKVEASEHPQTRIPNYRPPKKPGSVCHRGRWGARETVCGS